MSIVKCRGGEELVVGILRGGDDDSPVAEREILALEPVHASDLISARDEAWWAGVLQDALTPDLHEHTWEAYPGESLSRDRMKGYVLELRGAGKSFRKHFPTASLAVAARRGAARLRAINVLEENDEFSFCLTTRPSDASDSDSSSTCAIRASVQTEPLVFEPLPLRDYLNRSELHVGPGRDAAPAPKDREASDAMSVFFPRDVWEEARELSREGGEDESAAVLTGRLARDVDSPARFLVIDDCLRADHAAESQFSVELTGDTWHSVRQRLDQRRRRLNRPHEIICGTTHGHNFKPPADAEGRRTCDACHLLEICSRSTAHASTDDLAFHQSVFTAAPFAVLLLWGWNAREQEEWRLYGLKNAALAPRPVHILND